LLVNKRVSDRDKRVGVVFWDAEDGLAQGYSNKIEKWGHTVIPFQWNKRLPGDLDLVFVYGPIKSIVPLVNQILELPPDSRPALAYVMTEQLPNPELPEFVRLGIGRAKSRLDRLCFREDPDIGWKTRSGLKNFVNRGRRYCYYGDLYWIQKSGVLNFLALWSHWTANFLRERGFQPIVLSHGRNPDWGDDLNIERDIPVLWLGKPGSKRRQQILARLRAELADRGIEVLVVDGVENPYVFDHERTRLLNRSKIVLNILREKWDDNTLRFGLAAQNKALIVSEPMLPHSQYRSGFHYVEAPINSLPETISFYLQNDSERQKITGQAYDFVMGKTRGAGIEELIVAALNGGQVRG
jgi:hypothetical protein